MGSLSLCSCFKARTISTVSRPMLQSSQDISDNDYEDDAPTQLVSDEPTLSKEEQERIRAEREEEEHKKTFKCMYLWHDAWRITLTQNNRRIWPDVRFQAFLKGETNIATDEAFAKAMHSYCEVFLKSERVQKVVAAGGFSMHDFREVYSAICNVEIGFARLQILRPIHNTVLSSWMTKFDTITKGDEETQGRTARWANEMRAINRAVTEEAIKGTFCEMSPYSAGWMLIRSWDYQPLQSF
ncbi:hypothetical protein OSTOST_09741 [Ostertagia ostertagi]